jgi:hypothetical protein
MLRRGEGDTKWYLIVKIVPSPSVIQDLCELFSLYKTPFSRFDSGSL